MGTQGIAKFVADPARPGFGAGGTLDATRGSAYCIAPDYIGKVQQRGSIGKKRKTAKC